MFPSNFRAMSRNHRKTLTPSIFRMKRCSFSGSRSSFASEYSVENFCLCSRSSRKIPPTAEQVFAGASCRGSLYVCSIFPIQSNPAHRDNTVRFQPCIGLSRYPRHSASSVIQGFRLLLTVLCWHTQGGLVSPPTVSHPAREHCSLQ